MRLYKHKIKWYLNIIQSTKGCIAINILSNLIGLNIYVCVCVIGNMDNTSFA